MNKPRWIWVGTRELRARAALLGTGLHPHAAEEPGSTPGMIKVTDSHPLSFARLAAGEGRWAVLEVDVKRLVTANFRPDEDVLEQGTRDYPEWEGVPADASRQERVLFFRSHAARLRSFWRETLRLMGTANYQGVIPPRAIRRVALLDAEMRPEVAAVFPDGEATVDNYRGLRSRYRTLTQWLFSGSQDTLQSIADIAAFGDREMLPELMDASAVEWWTRVLEDRTGVEVTDNPGYGKWLGVNG